MTNGHGIETSANKIATARATLALAIRLSAEVESGRINTTIYSREVIIETGESGVRLPAFDVATPADLKNGIFNLLLIALSASALTLDETLDEAFGNVASDTDQSRLGIRVMVNQLRNAFAHNPWRPRWRIFQKYQNAYPISLYDGSMFIFNAAKLDGQQVQPAHVGGFEFWSKILLHCEKLVA